MVIAEAMVSAIQFYFVRKDIKIIKLYKNLIRYNLSGLAMFIFVLIIDYSLDSSYKTTIIQGFSGILIYIMMLFLLKSDINSYVFKQLAGKFTQVTAETVVKNKFI